MEIPKSWKLLLNKGDIKYFVNKCADKLNNTLKKADRDIVVVCILNGGVYFHVDLTRLLEFQHSCHFIKASSYGDSQKAGTCNIIKKHINKIADKYVILLDELCDTGETLFNIKKHFIEECGVNEDYIITCTLFNKFRPDRKIHPDVYGVKIPDVWVVGYGLDYKQKYRNLHELYATPKVKGITRSCDDTIFDDVYLYSEKISDIAKQKYI